MCIDDTDILTTDKVFKSITSYINKYVDTSFKKDVRLDSARKAAEICQHYAQEYPKNSDTDKMIYGVFNKLALKLNQASTDRNNLYNFENEIGFLNIINNSVRE